MATIFLIALKIVVCIICIFLFAFAMDKTHDLLKKFLTSDWALILGIFIEIVIWCGIFVATLNNLFSIF